MSGSHHLKGLDDGTFDVRRLTPAVQDIAYFCTSGLFSQTRPGCGRGSPLGQVSDQGPALPHIAAKMGEMFEETRAKVAEAFNADSSEIVLGKIRRWGSTWLPTASIGKPATTSF